MRHECVEGVAAGGGVDHGEGHMGCAESEVGVDVVVAQGPLEVEAKGFDGGVHAAALVEVAGVEVGDLDFL